VIILAIDTAAELAGAGLFDDGTLMAEISWRSRQNQSRELLPAVDWLLSSRGLAKAALEAIAVCTGPGSYAGLRVGISAAKGLAFGLGIPLMGIGRLAGDAEPYAIENGPTVFTVQAAGRAELAWAAYRREGGVLEEEIAPHLSPEGAILETAPAGSIALGEISPALLAALQERGVLVVERLPGRIQAIATLASRRLAAGDHDSVDALVPLYLREPAIGPQAPIVP
jgi:tRNA threonylcarbamoyladenosine biosynthesis protein TsaB